MRWLGNKTALLEDILNAAVSAGYSGGTVCDLFAGSGTVGRFFRAQGHRVVSTDLMKCSEVFQKAYLETTSPPAFEALSEYWKNLEPLPSTRLSNVENPDLEKWRPFLCLSRYLEEELPPRDGVLFRQFSNAGEAQRNYLTPENAARLDAILGLLRSWIVDARIEEQEVWVLLASCIDAADRVANISGTYGAYLKTIQKSALRPIQLKAPALVFGPKGQANSKDAIEWVSEIDCDLLYIDPPYNQRQYPANYHLPEILATLPFENSDERIESSVYGKTGLIPWKEKASPLCSRRGSDCFHAMQSMIENSKANIIVFSYSEEGILNRSEIETILSNWSGGAGRRKPKLIEIPHRRFRSDSDEDPATGETRRNFKPAPGRTRDQVHEWLFVASQVSDVTGVKG